jgi:hypothetical protein
MHHQYTITYVLIYKETIVLSVFVLLEISSYWHVLCFNPLIRLYRC